MPKARMRAATLSGSADDVEAAFYEALQAGDVERFMACWADEDDIVCVLPGVARLVGAAAIRAAFAQLFDNGGVQASATQICRLPALASAVHSVIERVGVSSSEESRTAWVVATNVYHKTAQGWRMVLHHASLGAHAELQELGHVSAVLH